VRAACIRGPITRDRAEYRTVIPTHVGLYGRIAEGRRFTRHAAPFTRLRSLTGTER